MSDSLEPIDGHRLNAAIGWMGLGNMEEARVELEKLSESAREHPSSLEIQFSFLAQANEWNEAKAVADRLREKAPDSPSGWLHYTYALRRIDGDHLQECWDELLPAAEKFPDESIIPYNLACYACQLGLMDEARQWLGRALDIGDKEPVKRMALKDEDLEPLWEEISGL